ncbi:DUF1987 domain-containing protein [Paenibacillus sp. N3.4]|nr:DUF1987 domain-containing protein [Paenibacillus sp. N3.4]
MQKIIIESSKSTPAIHFDPQAHVLSIQGQSYPENAFKFYEPILKWMDDYLDQLNEATIMKIELMLPYINTSSTKCFMTLLEKLDEAYDQGKNISIYWYYDQENETELECAQEFQEDLTLPFHILPKVTS